MRFLPLLILLAGFGTVHAAGPATIIPVAETATTVSGQPIAIPEHPHVVATRVIIPAGTRLPVHKHPHQRYAYVLAGDLNLINAETGQQRLYRPGEFLVETRGTWHTGEAVGGAVELLVLDHLPEGVEANTILK